GRAMQELQPIVDAAWEGRAELDGARIAHLRPQLERVLDSLESGALRVAEPHEGGWRVHQWIKKAVLLYFRVNANREMDGGPMAAFDKVPLRFAGAGDADLVGTGARIAPGALVRRGAF